MRGGGGSGWWLDNLGFESSDDLLFGVAAAVVIGGVGALVDKGHKKWQARRDPPLSEKLEADETNSSLGVHTSVHWKWEQLLADGDAVGPVQVSIYFDGDDEPAASKEWPHWAKRSEALAYAQERGFVFVPQDLPAG